MNTYYPLSRRVICTVCLLVSAYNLSNIIHYSHKLSAFQTICCSSDTCEVWKTLSTMLCWRYHVSFSFFRGCVFPLLSPCWLWSLTERAFWVFTCARDHLPRELLSTASHTCKQKHIVECLWCNLYPSLSRKSMLYKCLCRTEPPVFPSLLAESKIQDIWSKSNSFRCLFRYSVFSGVFGRLSNSLWLDKKIFLSLNMTMCRVLPLDKGGIRHNQHICL